MYVFKVINCSMQMGACRPAERSQGREQVRARADPPWVPVVPLRRKVVSTAGLYELHVGPCPVHRSPTRCGWNALFGLVADILKKFYLKYGQWASILGAAWWVEGLVAWAGVAGGDAPLRGRCPGPPGPAAEGSHPSV